MDIDIIQKENHIKNIVIMVIIYMMMKITKIKIMIKMKTTIKTTLDLFKSFKDFSKNLINLI